MDIVGFQSVVHVVVYRTENSRQCVRSRQYLYCLMSIAALLEVKGESIGSHQARIDQCIFKLFNAGKQLLPQKSRVLDIAVQRHMDWQRGWQVGNLYRLELQGHL